MLTTVSVGGEGELLPRAPLAGPWPWDSKLSKSGPTASEEGVSTKHLPWEAAADSLARREGPWLWTFFKASGDAGLDSQSSVSTPGLATEEGENSSLVARPEQDLGKSFRKWV